MTQTKKRSPLLIIVAVIVGLCVILAIIGSLLPETTPVATTSPPTNPPPATQTTVPTITPQARAEVYVAQYGGNLEVYVEIFTSTDCVFLQEKFDIASTNNANETAGTPQFQWTLGFMMAADERMKEVGCY